MSENGVNDESVPLTDEEQELLAQYSDYVTHYDMDGYLTWLSMARKLGDKDLINQIKTDMADHVMVSEGKY